MAALEPVPSWLQGVWIRESIRRAQEDGELGPADASVQVLYVQTPLHFVDVRRPHEDGKDGVMAFAGVTTTLANADSGAGGQVSWHACLDLESKPDSSACWAAVGCGTPLATEDVGDFSLVSLQDQRWREVDPKGSYEEIWKRVDDGQGKFLAARCGDAVLVVAGDYFGFAQDASGRCQYLAGRVSSGWIVDVCAVDRTIEGQRFVIPGTTDEWSAASYSTIAWPPSGLMFEASVIAQSIALGMS